MRILIVHARASELAAALTAAMPEHRFLAQHPEHDWPDEAFEAEAVVTMARLLPAQLVARMPNLRWVQAMTTGTDGFAAALASRKDVVLTSARGIHGPAVSEMVFMQMLALSRDLPALLVQQHEQHWERRRQMLLHETCAVIVGSGVIASALAQRCKAFGMQTIGLSSVPREVPHFDEVRPRSKLLESAAEADYLIALVPLDDQTRGMIGADVFGAMKPSAYFINVSRGGVCDEAALRHALLERRIAGAALDVFAVEPLPKGDPLWTTPRLIITPHLAGESERYLKLMQPIIEHNVRALAEGRVQDLMNRTAF